jgi:hypothetical protein
VIEFPEEYIRGRLKSYSDEAKSTRVVRGIFSNLSLFLLLSVVALYLDALVVPNSVTVVAILLLILVLQCIALYIWLLLPLMQSVDSTEISRRLERSIPAFYGRLTAALEDEGKDRSDRWGYSNSLRKKAIGSAADILRRIRGDVIARRLEVPVWIVSPVLIAGSLSCLLVICSGIILKWPLPLAPSVGRMLNPLSLYRTERTWDLMVRPGHVSVLRGDSLSIEVRALAGSGQLEPYFHLIFDGKRSDGKEMTKVDGLSYRFDAGPIDKTFQYLVTEGKRKSPAYDVKVIERPVVTELRFRIITPDYTGIPSREVGRGTRELVNLKGGRIELSGRGSNGLKRAFLDFTEEEDVELEITDRIDFSGGFPVMENDSFNVVLIDTSNIWSGKGNTYSLRILSDRKPGVRIVIPGADADLGGDLEETLRFSAGDDFGLLDLEIDCTVESREGEEKNRQSIAVASFGSGTRDTIVDYQWDLKGLGLFPGEKVRYRGRIRDNDRIAGPKSSWSREYLFSLPTVSEIFSRRQREIEEVSGGVKELMEKTNRLRDAVETLEREIKASGKLDWEGRKGAAEILRKQEELSSELNTIANQFHERVEKLKREGGISPHVLRRAEEVSRLFQEVATPEMMSAIEELRKVLEKVDQALLERALDELKFSEEDFFKGLDKTYRALKRLQMGQRLDSRVQEASNVLGRQQKLLEKLERDEDLSKLEKWRREEESIASDMDRLLSDMERTSDDLREEGEEEVSDQLDKLSEEIENLQVRSDMDDMAMKIGGGDLRGAMTRGEEIEKELDYLKKGLEDIREGLGMRWKKEMADVIDRAVDDLLTLSSSEEALYGTLPNEDAPEVTIDSFIADQSALQEGLEKTAERLFHSTEDTYFIGRDVGQKIGSALNLMRRLSHQVESKGSVTPSTKDDIMGALTSLNGAILSLMRDKESMVKSSSGVGLEKAFQQMMELAKSQAALNENTAGMFPLPFSGRPGLDQNYSEQLLRMAAEQRRIQEGLESILDDLSGESGLLGSVDQIAEDMKNVAEDLGEGRIDKEILERQRKIYSRLLDAEKSLRKRDFSRKREAEKPHPYLPSSPPPLSMDTYRDEDIPSEELFPTAGWEFPEGYRDAIRIYFDELMKQKIGGKGN